MTPAATTREEKSKKIEKPFNLITYKLHALPDYPDAIVRFGTTDSTSTQNDIEVHEEDPALKDFAHRLKSHLRGRILNMENGGYDVQFSDEELISVAIQGDLLYTHATMRVNSTTYDVQRDQDVLNPRTRKFFIVHAQDPEEDSHPYWYGELIGIFHCYASLADRPAKAQCMEFLWVRWFQRDTNYRCGLQAKRWLRLCYMPHGSPDAFGFIDPQDVLRGSHLIPAFHHGRTRDYLPKSALLQRIEHDEDWRYHYANMVVDRDMLMRYHVDVIGHRKVAQKFQVQDESPQESAAAVEEDAEMEVDEPDPMDKGVINEEDEEDEEDEEVGVDGRSSSSESEEETTEEESDEDDSPQGDEAVRSRLGFTSNN
ncbi:hypothetical protein MIND_01244900 [Mycena indigotica]|uniref:Uncharacterized protein n=1 Tax=Mycena indigotica TaxID=2126181 RepID=A0A8H6S3N8_9AGAR|nr:uncharacterized protein MIND_01244900 [Mycena indigotica]KAF7292176.1 hypothetical protein MIND_01244900 [Mycena indigotica]